LAVKLPRGVTFVRGSSTGNLPAAVASAGKISWNVKAPVAPFHVLTGHVILRLTRAVSGTFAGQLMTHLASGEPFTTSSKAPLHVVTTPRRITVMISGNRGTQSIATTLTASLGKRASQGAGKDRVVVHLGSARTITLRSTSMTVRAQGAPTRLSVGLSVSGSAGLPACRTGTVGKLEILDFDAIRNAIHTADTVRVALPRECGGTSLYSDSAGAGRTIVKVGFR
jgi:hypothetical protein